MNESARGQRIRVGILLAILAVVGLYYLKVRHDENAVPDWRSPELASIVLLVPPGRTPEEAQETDELTRFVRSDGESATFRELQEWLTTEFGRYVSRPGFEPVHLFLVGPVELPKDPPEPPGDGLSFEQRYERTKAFLDFEQELRGRAAVKTRNCVFVDLFRPKESPQLAQLHSLADRRSRTGFVFAPLTTAGAHEALIDGAHELLHLFGAKDEYEGDRCVFPQGFAEPFREPRYPQRFAEVMAQAVPTSESARERALERFADIRVGVETAYEIGWIDRERCERYYRGDLAAGPRADPEAK